MSSQQTLRMCPAQRKFPPTAGRQLENLFTSSLITSEEHFGSLCVQCVEEVMEGSSLEEKKCEVAAMERAYGAARLRADGTYTSKSTQEIVSCSFLSKISSIY